MSSVIIWPSVSVRGSWALGYLMGAGGLIGRGALMGAGNVIVRGALMGRGPLMGAGGVIGGGATMGADDVMGRVVPKGAGCVMGPTNLCDGCLGQTLDHIVAPALPYRWKRLPASQPPKHIQAAIPARSPSVAVYWCLALSWTFLERHN